MPVAQPPYALTQLPFRFGALASLAGRAPLGGKREVTMALYLGARLAQDTLPEREIPEAARRERAGHAKHWLSTLALPPAVRPALASLIDASAGEPGAASKSVRAALTATGEVLDKDARAELLQLATALERG
ncbi:MAG TPA: hypothetical protein VHV78_06590 [Gemmatimonadaceae bacterium]|jgi:hypothetical protein|nr:hypothetical protein [Gemmatimonadaceae bacterium]